MPHRNARFALVFVPLLALAACKNTPPAPAATTSAASTAVAPAETQPAAPAPGSQRLAITPANSSVGFVGAKITAQHEGRFERFAGSVDLQPDHPEQSRIYVDIETASLTVQPERLSNHLKSGDFFDVARFPHATFSSSEIRAGGANGATHTITGTLTLHGQSRVISFPANVTVAPGEVTATADFQINRKDFGLVYPGMPDDLIRDQVTIRLNLRLPRT